MKRITGATVDANLFGAGKDGFTNGQPGVKAATVVTREWLGAVQEEIVTAIERSGLPVEDSLFLYEAIDETANMRAVGLAIANHVSRTAPAAVNYTKVAYGEGVFVATNDGATGPHTSVDGGVTWTSRSVTSLNNVFYSPQGRFLAVGAAGALVTSEDGLAWTARTPAAAYAGAFQCCAGNNAVFVAAGAAGEIQTSANGTSGWTHRTPAAAFAGTWFGATVTASGRFVLVGFSAPDIIAIQTSDDSGVTWTSRTPSDTNGGVYAVACGEPITGEVILIAVGLDYSAGPSSIMRSVDLGVTWANITAPGGHDLGYADVRYDLTTNLFVAVGLTGQIAISRDGLIWRSVQRASYTAVLNGVGFGDGTCILAGNTSALRQSLNFPWDY